MSMPPSPLTPLEPTTYRLLATLAEEHLTMADVRQRIIVATSYQLLPSYGDIERLIRHLQQWGWVAMVSMAHEHWRRYGLTGKGRQALAREITRQKRAALIGRLAHREL